MGKEKTTKHSRLGRVLTFSLQPKVRVALLLAVAFVSVVTFWLLVAVSSDARDAVRWLILSLPQPISSDGILMFAALLLPIAVSVYFLLDYHQHSSVFVEEGVKSTYGPLHHARKVFLPRLLFNWRQGAYLLSAGFVTTLVLITALTAVIKPIFAYAPDEFVTTWSANTSITIPTTGSGYNYNVDWGDGSSDTGLTGDATHDYGVAGVYEVKITGTFPRIYINSAAPNKDRLLSVEQWGTNQWSSMNHAFSDASNLEINAVDAPDLSSVTDMSYAFSGATSLNQSLDNWDVSNVQNFNYMFLAANVFNQSLGGWNMSGATSTEGMFMYASAFNQPVSTWSMGGVANMTAMFYNATVFNQSLANWDVSSVTSMAGMLAGAGMSTSNYDAMLDSWATQSLQSSVTFNASATYCLSTNDRQSIIDSYGWTITDGGEDPGCIIEPFVTTWKTDNPGTTLSTQIRIPTTGGGYNYSVDWGDGSNSTGLTGSATHTYATAGTYTVTLSGDFPRIYFANGGDRQKILTIEQWGSIEWESMESAFMGASNLQVNASDAPDLSGVTDLEQMFAYATNFNSDISSWDVSTIQSFNSMFHTASSFNQPLNSWNTSSLSSMSAMFMNADSFNQPLDNWDVSGVSDFAAIFNSADSFNQPLAAWDVSGATDMSVMLSYTSMSTNNYDATLIAWSAQPLQTGVTLMATGVHYCASETERQSIISTYSWTIMDAGKDCFADAFVTTWKTDNTGYGSSASNQVTIPTTGSGYNYSVDWGDGTTSTGVTGDTTHTYATPGTYEVSITGDFPRIYCYTNEPGGWDCYHKLLSVDQWGDIEWSSMESSFHSAQHLEINASDAPDLSGATSTSNMFNAAQSFNQDISHWDVSTITDMSGMFAVANAFNQPLNDWDVSNVTDMRNMFFGAYNFDQPLNNWDTGNVTEMGAIFLVATSFDQDISSWDTSSAVNMDRMFEGADSFNQDISSWDVGDVTTMSSMFKNNDAFNQDLPDWDTASVTTMEGMFYRATAFNGEVANWDTGNVTNMSGMFYYTPFNKPVNSWDVSQVEDFSNMFLNASAFNQPLDNWETNNATNMYGMFQLASVFNQPLNSWNTSGVASMGSMFSSATAFNQPLDNWDTSQVLQMQAMFNDTSFDQDISSWDTSNVTEMFQMFAENSAFNQPLNSWNTGNVRRMQFMFQNATAFNQPLDNWDTSGLQSNHEAIRQMFYGATSFNQDISSWDMSGVTNTHAMFYGATSFNQSLADWDVGNMTYMAQTFTNSGLSTKNYDATLIGWHDQGLENNVQLGSGSFYCMAANQRQTMIDDYGWTINDAGEDCGEYDAPSITTSPASSVTDEQATLNGDITADGGAAITNAGFQWGETNSYGTTISGLTTEVESFAAAVALDTCGQTYHYRAFATNAIGTTYGDDQTFTSGTCFKEAVTEAPEQIDESSAQLKGSINGESKDDFVSAGFEWGTTPSYGSSMDGLTISGDSFSASVPGFDCDTLYHYRAFAVTGDDETSYGANTTFTLDCPSPDPESPSANLAPTVEITKPKNGQSFKKDSEITLSAKAEDQDGEVTEVRFYVSGVLVGKTAEAPYDITGGASNPGVYELIAVATDNDGADKSSALISFIVTEQQAEDDEVFEGSTLLTPNAADIYPDGGLEASTYTFKGRAAAIGQSIPWVLLVILSGVYFTLGYSQSRQNATLVKIFSLTKHTKEELEEFSRIVSHYLGTSVSLMSGSLQVLPNEARQSEPALGPLKTLTQKVTDATNVLIGKLQQSTSTIKEALNTKTKINNKELFLYALVPVLIAGVLLAISLILLPFLKVWSFDAQRTLFYITLFIASAGLVVTSYMVFRRQDQLRLRMLEVTKNAEKLLQTKRQFIAATQLELSTYTDELSAQAEQLTDEKTKEHFSKGLSMYSYVAAAFAKVQKLTAAVTAGTIKGDIPIIKIVNTYKELAKQKGVALTTSVQNKLEIQMLPAELQHVLETLLDNAIEHTAEGGTVHLSITKTRRKLHIKVSDTGSGISKARLKDITQPFTRGTTTETYDYEGLGLNLYITRLIAQKYEGSLSIDSVEGKGTRVGFTV